MDETHFLFVFLEEKIAAGAPHFLLVLDIGSHFLGEVEGGAHLAFSGGGGLAQLLHGLADFAAHHSLKFGDGPFHHGGEVFEGTTDSDSGFDGFEFALEFLNFADALGDDLGIGMV